MSAEDQATPDAVEDQPVTDGDPAVADDSDQPNPEAPDVPDAPADDDAEDGGAYVVVSDVLYHVKDGARRRYKRGDTITGLSDEDAKRLKASGAIAAPSSSQAKDAEDDPGEDLRPAPDAGKPTPDTASHITAAAASGVTPMPRPPTAAGVAIWRKYAISRGLSEADVATADKKTLQEITR